MLVPIRDRIIVVEQDDDLRAHRPQALLVTTAAIDDMKRGEVVAVGPGYLQLDGSRMHQVELSVKAGDVIIYKKGSGMECVSYGRKYLVLQEQHVLAIEMPDKKE